MITPTVSSTHVSNNDDNSNDNMHVSNSYLLETSSSPAPCEQIEFLYDRFDLVHIYIPHVNFTYTLFF